VLLAAAAAAAASRCVFSATRGVDRRTAKHAVDNNAVAFATLYQICTDNVEHAYKKVRPSVHRAARDRVVGGTTAADGGDKGATFGNVGSVPELPRELETRVRGVNGRRNGTHLPVPLCLSLAGCLP
jgi:hypothetical protein